MALVRLRKWYFDFLADGRLYLFFYIAKAVAVGQPQSHFHLSLADRGNDAGVSVDAPLGGKEVAWTPDSIRADGCVLQRSGDRFEVHVDHRDVRLDLCFRRSTISGIASGLLIPVGRRGAITWTATAPGCTVDGEAVIRGRRLAVRGQNGYCDFLDVDALPFPLPVRRLLWVRLHAEKVAFTYTVVENRPPRSTRALAVLEQGGTEVALERVVVTVESERFCKALGVSYPDRYQLRAESPTAEVLVTVTRIQEAVVSQFLGEKQVANPLQRAVYRRVSGNPRGIKFLSEATTVLKIDGTRSEFRGIPMIDEWVAFSA